MEHKIYIFILLTYIFSAHCMEVKSVFFSEKEAGIPEYKKYSDELIKKILECESHTYRDLWGYSDFMLKDGGSCSTICESATPQITSSEGGDFVGDFHIVGNFTEKHILNIAKKRSHDKKYKPAQTFSDSRRWWHRYGNYTAGFLGCLICYNVWQYVKSSK